MDRKILLLAILIIPAFQIVLAQQNTDKWDHWNTLVGEWRGDGEGQPGSGAGTFSIQFDLNKSILVRKGHTEFPPAEGKEAVVHDDLMIIYPDHSGVVNKAVYFDNENHVINYSIIYGDHTIVFTSEAIPGVPVFRLTYELLDSSTINIKFAMASPGKPGEFMTYVEGKSRKIK